MPRAMGWVSDKGATDQVARIAEVNQFLRDIRIPASVVARDADMTTLREIFDRMNSSGKRLRGAEIFDAINRSLGNNSADTDSTAVVADRVAAATTFGRVSDDVVHQAILVRRHPDFARDPHGEFGSERQQISNFPDEDQTQAYRGCRGGPDPGGELSDRHRWRPAHDFPPIPESAAGPGAFHGLPPPVPHHEIASCSLDGSGGLPSPSPPTPSAIPSKPDACWQVRSRSVTKTPRSSTY